MEDDEQERERQRRLEQLKSILGDYDAQYSLRASTFVDFNVDSKLNRYEKQKITNSKQMEGEQEELVKLKYGEGSIGIRTRVRKKDGSIYKIYYGTYYDEYGKHKTVYGKTQKECLRKLREAHPKTKRNQPTRKHYLLFKDWLLEWFNTFKVRKIRASTVKGYENIIKVHILPNLGKFKLHELTGERLQRFFNTIEFPNTRKKTFDLVRSCLDKALVLRKIDYNYCNVVELPTYKKKKRRPFTYEEQNKILANGSDVQRQIFFFLCATGLRIGEFLALTKEDFNFEEHYFFVNKSISVEGNTKTEAGNRIIYFTDELIKNFDFDLLGKYRYAGLRTNFRRLLDKLGIKGVCLHCTRHTFATVCHSFNMNDKTLQFLLGHSTLQMTQDVYTHIIKKGSSNISRYLEDLCVYIHTII